MNVRHIYIRVEEAGRQAEGSRILKGSLNGLPRFARLKPRSIETLVARPLVPPPMRQKRHAENARLLRTKLPEMTH